MPPIELKPLSTYVLRTPLFSFNRLSDFYDLADGKADAFTKKEIQLIEEAIYLATPDLFDVWKKWISNELTDQAEIRKLQTSLIKYFKRMCTRCTPFGLFAGCTTGSFSDENIQLKTAGDFTRHTRLDMHYVCSLAQEWSKKEVVKQNILHYPNSSIYALGDNVRYVDYHYKGKNRVHNISSVENNYYLDKVLRLAEKGAYLQDFVNCITQEGEAKEEAKAFVEEMLSRQLLVNELEPSVTGTEFTLQLERVLNGAKNRVKGSDGLEEIENMLQQLQQLSVLINAIDENVGNPMSAYNELLQKVVETGVPFEKSKLVQTDLYTQTEQNKISPSVHKEVLKGLGILNRLTAYADSPSLKRFRERYTQRYGKAKMPLLQVLDVESGIGYIEGKDGDSSPLIENVPYGVTGGESKIPWNTMQSFLLKKLRTAAENNELEVELTDADFKSNEPDWADVPDTLAIMLRHLGKRDGQDVLFFGSAGGSSAANLLGRFAHGSNSINDMIEQITAREQENKADTALAEIVHLPQSRIGNILMRPVFRDYEIPYLAKSSVDQDHVISLADLTVSVERNRVILFSEKLQKEVKPHLSTAHNYRANSLPVYHFLCDLQHQNQRSALHFTWGSLQNEFKVLPRVRYGNILFALATWKLVKADYKNLLDCAFSDLEKAGKDLMETCNLPAKVVLADGDNELYVDLQNVHSLNVFRKTIKKRPSIKLVEFGYDMDTSIVKNGQGEVFTNQMVLVFEKLNSRPTESTKAAVSTTKSQQIAAQRTFFIGDEWLYYKIYCGVKTADEVLAQCLEPLASELHKNRLIDSWFFIRYSDPDKHIRIRFHVSDKKAMGEVINSFKEALQPWLESQEVWNITCDSYVRELERYGHSTMEISEKLFYHESVAITRLLQLQPDEHTRWLFALAMIDALLTDFDFDEAAKEKLLWRMKEGFAREFGASKNTRQSLAKKYRAERQQIERFLKGELNGTAIHHDAKKIVDTKGSNTAQIVTDIKEKIVAENVLLGDLMISYIHMLMNRTFRSRQRLHEMVLYDFLHVTYKSQNARNRKMLKQTQTA